MGLEYQCSNVRDCLEKPQVSLLLQHKMCLRALCNVRLLPQAVYNSKHTVTCTVQYVCTVQPIQQSACMLTHQRGNARDAYSSLLSSKSHSDLKKMSSFEVTFSCLMTQFLSFERGAKKKKICTFYA